jgi:UDP-N-acetylmuramyl pentapeptide phosphotransferase/UDP-N-acetylglucosamine-1-phosphate transferase
MLDIAPSLWQWHAFSAAMSCAFVLSLGLVLTKKHHGHFTLDSTIGVQKCHADPTPRVGGIAIYVGLLLAWLVVADKGAREILGAILAAGLIPLACGLAEDVTKRVGVLPRLLATMAGGLAAWMLTGIALNRVDVYGFDRLLALTPLAVLFTAFAVGGVANAINIIDGFHGLASGTTIIALTALGAIAARAGDLPLAIACFLVAAPIAGFGLVNYPWGKLFMGDGGAYFSGFALAWLAVLLPMRNPGISVWAGLLVCVYPVIEVLYSVVRRTMRHQSPGAPDTGHLHSLIKVKLVRPSVSAKGLDTTMCNAAVSPIVWTFTCLPAIAAATLFDRPVMLAIAIVVCAFTYHAAYQYLARKEAVAFSDSADPSGLSAYQFSHRHARHPRHRARDRRAASGR